MFAKRSTYILHYSIAVSNKLHAQSILGFRLRKFLPTGTLSSLIVQKPLGPTMATKEFFNSFNKPRGTFNINTEVNTEYPFSVNSLRVTFTLAENDGLVTVNDQVQFARILVFLPVWTVHILSHSFHFPWSSSFCITTKYFLAQFPVSPNFYTVNLATSARLKIQGWSNIVSRRTPDISLPSAVSNRIWYRKLRHSFKVYYSTWLPQILIAAPVKATQNWSHSPMHSFHFF